MTVIPIELHTRPRQPFESTHTGQAGRVYTPKRVLRGRVHIPGSTRLIIATDGSYKSHIGGAGYVSRNGYWALDARPMARSGRLNPIRNHGTGALTQEIRAVGMAVADFPGRSIKFLVDSTSAIEFLRAWQAGYTDRMPPGYSLRPRINGDGKPALVRLAETIAGRTDLRFVHVAGHTGVHLNEVADSLAKMAREAAVCRVDEAVLGERATRLVTGFLQEIHGQRSTAA